MSELPELIQALLDPQAYPAPPQKVELAQTQMSYVFIAGEHVYKIKKPVDFGFLDYTTLEKRLTFCIKELELNRRLCPDAYLEVVPVTDDDGRTVMDGRGTVKEYAVKMRRLPRESMMDVLLAKNKVTPEMANRVAERLAEFHRRAATGGEIDEFGNTGSVFQNTDENFTQTEPYIGSVVPADTHRHLRSWNENFIKTNESLFHKRVEEGRIRDCHGDLHAAHVCFTNGICIYDCIEFNDRFRYCDVASEVAFLAMDLDHYGRPDLSGSFIDAYVKASGDDELGKLLNFYKCYRACVRAKVGCFQYDDPYISADEKAKILNNTRSYFKLAESYIEGDQGDKMREPFEKLTRAQLKPAFLLIACGLPGTWKTETTEEVAKIKGCKLLRTDLIRLEVLKSEDVFDARVAGDMGKRTQVYDVMFQQADEALDSGNCVILDATFVTQSLRQRAAAIAAKHGVTFVILQTDCPQEVSIRRILARDKENYVSNALTEEAYLNNKKKFEAVDLDNLKSLNPDLNIVHLVVDTTKDPPQDWYITRQETR